MITCVCGVEFEPPARKRGEAKRHCSMRCKTRAWRAADADRYAAVDARQDEKRRLFKVAHPEIAKTREAQRYRLNPESHRARVAAYRSIPENRARLNATSVKWRAMNPAKYHAAVRRWESEHPASKAHHQATRRARRSGNGGSHTVEEWRDKCAAFGNRCAYCRESKPLTRDHDIPLSRGGTDFIANIIPSCKLCNSKKRTRTAEEFLLTMPTNDATNALIRIA
jgi:hypothetical protein